MIAVDGPRDGKPNDFSLVVETRKAVEEINWDCRIHTRFRERNLGLQTAYVDAVNWAMSEFGETIVIEDDVIAGPELYEFLSFNLKEFRDTREVGQVNGYNFVPTTSMTDPNASRRVTRYPTSYCWASWNRSWELIDLSIQWRRAVSLSDLANITGSLISALMWKINFDNAVKKRVDTWDYAWLATLWKHDLKIISPNRNLCLYDGFDGGTHTRRKVEKKQIEIESLKNLSEKLILENDDIADFWQSKNVFHETLGGLLEKSAASLYLEVEKRIRKSTKG